MAVCNTLAEIFSSPSFMVNYQSECDHQKGRAVIALLTDRNTKTKAMPDKRIKNEEQYQALRDKGYSKRKSARIANTPDSGKKGGSASPYEDWSRDSLYEKAKKVGIKGRSSMNKEGLIKALRNS